MFNKCFTRHTKAQVSLRLIFQTKLFISNVQIMIKKQTVYHYALIHKNNTSQNCEI